MTKEITENLPILAIVTPCFNESKVAKTNLNKLYDLIEELVTKGVVSDKSMLLVVNDGSTDQSRTILEEASDPLHNCNIFSFDENKGHQIAIIAGMDSVVDDVDVIVTIDFDLQQDIRAIEDFLYEYKQGCQIVLGIRKNRKTDSFFKKNTAWLYRGIMKLLGIKYYAGHADYRLVSSVAYKNLQKEVWANQFLRSVFSNTKYKTALVKHEVFERNDGDSKYTLKKMVSLGLEGIFTNSIHSLRFIGFLGLITTGISIIMITYIILAKMLSEPADGWSSLLVTVSFFGGVIVFCLSLLSEVIVRLLKKIIVEKPY